MDLLLVVLTVMYIFTISASLHHVLYPPLPSCHYPVQLCWGEHDFQYANLKRLSVTLARIYWHGKEEHKAS